MSFDELVSLCNDTHQQISERMSRISSKSACHCKERTVFFNNRISYLTRISHTISSRDAARTCSCEARAGFSAGLYGDILPKDNSVRNEAGKGPRKSQ